jgi:hypothetical protein
VPSNHITLPKTLTKLNLEKKELKTVFTSGTPQSNANFQNLIQAFCQQSKWGISSLYENLATLNFSMEGGGEQIVEIKYYEPELLFSVFCPISFDDDDILHAFSTILLTRNSLTDFGHWSLKKGSDKYYVQYTYTTRLQLLNAQHFYEIVVSMIIA